LFSAALTAFVNDSKENLQVKPQDEMVYYLRQHSIILSQISQQLSSITPQVSIPSAPPPPFPEFNPLPSDIRINIFWFMSLIFSLLAALLAVLVQQWVRDYMHVFQRYSDPLKSARLRQYLYEGSEGWYMPVVAEAVPGLLHFSLFLFFAGLVDSLLRINTTVGLSTVVPIGITGLLYFFTILAPILYPQSPYQNSFSGVFWYLFQKLRGRRYKDRGLDGGMKSVSADMAQGQMQLAMEETEKRKSRDVRAILRLVDNLTEDAEMEQFLTTIPGSFNTNWGAEVWKKVGNMMEEKPGTRSQNEPVVGTFMDTTAPTAQAMPLVLQPSRFESARSVLRPIIPLVRKFTPHHPLFDATTLQPVPYSPNVYPHSDTANIQGEDILHGLSSRVARFLETCKNRGIFANDDLWQRRTRACIETTASLVLCANANLAWFGDITKLLEDIGSFEKTRELSEKGMDQLFVIRWSCLSLVAIRKILEDDWDVRSNAGEAVTSLAEEDNTTGNNQALTRAQKADKTLHNARKRLDKLYNAMSKAENLTEAKEILRDHESEILELEKINIEADSLEDVDRWMFDTQSSIAKIISQFPGIRDVDGLDPVFVRFSHFVEQFCDPRKVQFIRPGRTLKSLCCIVPTLRDILGGQGDVNAYQDMFNGLKTFVVESRWRGDELQRRQLWRMQDLRDGSGFGFTVELFFLALQQLLSTSSSPESHSTLYMGTFRAITSDWSKYKDSLGTQKILLDIVVTRGWEFDLPGRYPPLIANEFLVLLGRVFEGQAGLHIDDVVQRLSSLSPDTLHARPRKFKVKALKVITQARAPSSIS
jgi:hypothetical protein